jgi:rare lipoprotein A (peptidoglycan hydrolase)
MEVIMRFKKTIIALTVFALLQSSALANYSSVEYTYPKFHIPQIERNVVALKPPAAPTKAPSAKIQWKSIKATYYRWQDFVGRHTADGTPYTPDLYGIASNSLPMHTWVLLLYKGKDKILRHLLVQVKDRHGRSQTDFFDMTSAVCKYLQHCFTGPINYYIVKQ